MTLMLKIIRAQYEVEDTQKIYWYHGRNPDWKSFSKENRANKKHIDGKQSAD